MQVRAWLTSGVTIIGEVLDYSDFYKKLLTPLEEEFGKLDTETITALVGFSMGGPVSLSKQSKSDLYVICELSAYPGQKFSTGGLKFELFSVGHFSEDWCRKVFTGLGNLSMNSQLGNGHTIDISDLVDSSEPIKKIALKFFSWFEYEEKRYGLYQVVPA